MVRNAVWGLLAPVTELVTGSLVTITRIALFKSYAWRQAHGRVTEVMPGLRRAEGWGARAGAPRPPSGALTSQKPAPRRATPVLVT